MTKKVLVRGMPKGIVGPHNGIVCNDHGCTACDPARRQMRRWAELRVKALARRRLVR